MNKRVISLIAAFALGVAALAAAPPAMAGSAGVSKVAFGDSEASGTGNFAYVDKDCKRSRFSYPLILRMESYACSGATTADLAGAGGQIDAAIAEGKLGAATKYVTITAGVNDLAWQDTLLTCYADPDPTLPGGPCQVALGIAAGQLPGVAAGLAGAIAKIRVAAPGAKILVTGYPLLFGKLGSSCSIGALGGQKVTITPTVKVLANDAVTSLNAVIENVTNPLDAADRVEYVDVAAAFAGHSLCDTRTPWLHGVIGLPVLYDSSLHINVAGQYALAAAVWRQR
ncbi:SGNH/GDSL hydrolase family protein [Microbacterium thalassium]|uniref:Lysophospholipase L1-like esterase n=1 Tax=Microbacterium thalassium TaxID=362649 RepID=A0A7X0FM70_9MICO|nr:SGNH/GDSL hydrolase family protein [Microbacterium thalassium]MBB6390072.1 lysophospholipase L1-like esterase [Microbacterium thalassium]GLK25180.1 hypothetical protein GCM10017607_24990 [Microbacterium thalassium]